MHILKSTLLKLQMPKMPTGFFLISLLIFVPLFLLSPSVNAQDSNLWGVIYGTDESPFGNVFKTDGNGDNYEVVHSFSPGVDAANPTTNGLIKLPDGMMYGTIANGGAYGDGAIFSYNPETGVAELVGDFNESASGKSPQGKLLSNGGMNFYGVTNEGGAFGKGTFFSFTVSSLGNFIQVYNHFDGSNDGSYPVGSLVQDSDGIIYGTTTSGGMHGYGTLFKHSFNQGGFEVVHHFDGEGGASPKGGLIYNWFYGIVGITSEGGANGNGVIFHYDPCCSSNSVEVLIDLEDTGVSNPVGGLVEENISHYYGMTSAGGEHQFGAIFEFDASDPSIEILHSFTTDNEVVGTLQMEGDMLFGLSKSGGANGGGFLFSYDLDQNVYSEELNFNPLQDGYSPEGSLELSEGVLYGLTKLGGQTNNGTIFSFDPQNSEFEKHVDFGVASGVYPLAGLEESLNGKLYGMSLGGGNNNDGTIYEVNPETEEVKSVFNFNETSSGRAPRGSLFLASDGWLYGMTQQGGNGGGTLFRFDPITFEVIVLHEFEEATGWQPEGSLAESSDTGKLYGTTSSGGASGDGAIFEYDLFTDSYSKLFDFGAGNGISPRGSLLEVQNGLLCGTTPYGGMSNYGTLFSYDPVNNVFEKLHDFDSSTGGTLPGTHLWQDDTNIVLGTTVYGGNGGGTIFDYNLNSDEFNVRVNLGDVGARPRGGLAKGSNEKYYGYSQPNTWEGSFFEYDPESNEVTEKSEFGFHPQTQYNGFTLSSQPIETFPEMGCSQDTDDDGFVGVSDLLNILATFSCPDLSCLQYDQNNDNAVNTNDLLIVIGMIGVECE